MIDKNSVEWFLLVDSLVDAKEHLANLINEMETLENFDEQEFSIQLGHIYAHLNRAWNSRHVEEGINSENWDALSQFPTDIHAIG
jgi:hypothetical protein